MVVVVDVTVTVDAGVMFCEPVADDTGGAREGSVDLPTMVDDDETVTKDGVDTGACRSITIAGGVVIHDRRR